MTDKLKTWIAAVGAVISVIIAGTSGGGEFTSVEIINLSIAVLTAISVYIVPELDASIAVYAKGIISFFMAGLATLVTLVADGVTIAEWWQVIVAALAAVGITWAPGPKHPHSASGVRNVT